MSNSIISKGRIFGAALLLLAAETTRAQNLPEVIKPAPEVAALGKYGETPVGTFTGVPDISIPLYTIQDGDLTVPMSLSYHAGGFKVEEESEWTGLGWSLFCGGSITRSIRGIDDFEIQSRRGYYYNLNVPDPFDFGVPYQQFPKPITGSPTDQYMLLKDGVYRDYNFDFAQTGADWESDLYYFNLNGLSGKFVLDEKKVPVLIQQKKVTIRLLDDKSGWVVYDDKGYKYTLNSSQSTFGGVNETVTGWYLTKIESPTGHSITFEYDKTNDFTITSIPTYTEYKINVLAANASDPGAPLPCSDNVIPEEYASPAIKYQKHYLRTIRFANGYVKFLRDSDFPEMTPRLDLIGAERLVSMQIYQQVGETGTPHLLKEYKLDYDYFTGGVGLGYQDKFMMYTSVFDYNKLTKRLKLVSVTECGQAEKCKPPYTFVYNEDKNLPSKASFSRDFWGYSNGISNTQLVPELRGDFNIVLGEEYEYRYFFGAKREPVGQHSEANLLKRITYPTGGSTQFTYHGNEYSNFEGLEYESVNYGPYYFDQGKSNNTGPLQFTLNKKATVSLRFEIHGTDYVFDPHEYFYVQLAKGVSPQAKWNLLSVEGDLQANGTTYTVYELILDAGTYTLTSNLPSDGSEKVTIRVVASWSEVGTVPLKRKPGGGVRVEKIENFDSENVSTNVSTFSYETDGGYSSGVLFSYPRFVTLTHSEYCNTLIRSSTSNIPLSTSSGGVIGYSKVTVWHGESGENGKTEYFYHAVPDLERPNISRAPNIPTFPDNRNGNLLKQIDYAYKGGVYGTVKEVVNDYSIGETPWKIVWNTNVQRYFSHMTGNVLYDIYCQCPPELPVYEFWLAHYGTVCDWNRLVSTNTKMYDPQDVTRYVETITQYEYANQAHFLPTNVTTTDSQGVTISAKSQYPADFTGTEYGSNILRDNHVHGTALTNTITKGAVVTSKTATTYKVEQNHPVIDFVQAAPNGVNMETRIVFYKYDGVGNILELSKSDDVRIAYLWGYKNSLPVAEIKNATYAQVLEVLGQTVIDQLNSNPGSDDQVRQLLQPLRTHPTLRNAYVSTYTYSPLTGMSGKTDENGNTTFYEYDDLQRLKIIRDSDGNIIESYKYHYQLD